MATTKAYELARLLADGFVGSSEIGSDQVLSGNLADNAVTTAKIANDAVTADKINIASSDVPYDNTVSGLSANTVKEAIDALNAISGGGNAGAQATFSREKFTATAGQTSFTVTGGYDVGYILVFMNGVLLDISDFTASDGVGFTLAVAAKAGDEIVAIKLDSFAIAELLRIFNTSASAPDDAVTVDASGNVLVGTTDDDPVVNNVDGVVVKSGRLDASNNGIAARFNRQASDGDIMQFRKDGSTVGSIGVAQSGDRTYFSGGSYGIASDTSDATIMPCNTTGGGNNGVVSLGKSDARFKDLYLSGGVYLGGTGSANKLDDYEEGTWTLVPPTGVSIGTTGTGRYTKVGRKVTVSGLVSVGSTSGSAYFDISGLPFTSAPNSYANNTQGVMHQHITAQQIQAFIGNNQSYIRFYACDGGAWDRLRANDVSTASDIYFTITYEAA